MGTTETTRRSALGILATGPLAMLPALAVMSCSQKVEAGLISPDVSSRLAAYREAQREMQRYSAEIATPTSDAFKRAAGAIPHHRTANSFENFDGGRTALSTKDPASVSMARKIVADNLSWAERDHDYIATLKDLIEAADCRDSERERLRAECALDSVLQREEELGDQCYDALIAFMKTPAQSIHDVLAKMEITEEEGRWKAAKDDLMADVMRLAGRA
ncbi:hypothetical protein HRJ34_25985 [Rhizorhabdus wittichii]|uniref:Uncharacterized protein n=1 Tax=Rhizorhabdus wittichii TaxID=160791 RepID=A0A975D2Z2_9SPHN|nr:hypothetical protein [Rhizorhabdus wittichii]QTH21709.1 hypothetical protein HRJ34_25985 [Rhizorhabdus wittichii]